MQLVPPWDDCIKLCFLPMDAKDIDIGIRNKNYIAFAGKKAYNINYIFYSILSDIKGGLSEAEAIKKISLESDIDSEEVKKSFYGFMTSVNHNLANNKSYIKGKIIIFRKNTTEKISHYFQEFFCRNAFFIFFTLSLLINIVFFVTHTNAILGDLSKGFTLFQLCALFVLSNIFVVFHEIGHASASLKFGLPARDIGFGFYFIFPVFFTDVTRVWLLSRNRRLVVNIAGIYFQLLANMCMIVIFCLTNEYFVRKILTYLIASNNVVMLCSAIPFFRNDGYWVYSDIFGVENLVTRADQLTSKWIHGIKWTKKECNKPLLFYLIGNWLFRLFIFYKLIEIAVVTYKGIEWNTINFTLINRVSVILISMIGVVMMITSMYSKLRKL